MKKRKRKREGKKNSHKSRLQSLEGKWWGYIESSIKSQHPPKTHIINYFIFILFKRTSILSLPVTNASVVICAINGVVPFDRYLLSSAFVLAPSTFIVCAGWPSGSNHHSPWTSIHPFFISTDLLQPQRSFKVGKVMPCFCIYMCVYSWCCLLLTCNFTSIFLWW